VGNIYLNLLVLLVYLLKSGTCILISGFLGDDISKLFDNFSIGLLHLVDYLVIL